MKLWQLAPKNRISRNVSLKSCCLEAEINFDYIIYAEWLALLNQN
jgi:hypothetical protein